MQEEDHVFRYSTIFLAILCSSTDVFDITVCRESYGWFTRISLVLTVLFIAGWLENVFYEYYSHGIVSPLDENIIFFYSCFLFLAVFNLNASNFNFLVINSAQAV